MGPRTGTLATSILICLVGAGARAAPPAAGDTGREARTHFSRGVSLYQRDQLEAAAHEFEEAHRLAPRPLLLYNLGHIHVRIGDLARAQDYFQRFLEAEPGSAQRAEVEQRIEILRSIVNAQRPRIHGASAESKEAPLDAPATPDEAPVPRADGAVAALAPEPQDDHEVPPFLKATPAPTPQPTSRSRHRLWIGLGAAAGGGAIITAVTLLSILVPRSASPPSTLGTFQAGL